MRLIKAAMLGACLMSVGRFANADDAGGGGGGGNDAPPAKTYTQADIDALQAQVTDLTTKHTEATGKLTAIEQAQLTEQQKLEQERDGLKTGHDTLAETLKQERLERQIEREAAGLNIVDPDAALRLLDSRKIEFDGDGKPKNVKALLEKLVTDKPYLVAPPASGGSPTNGARPVQASGATFTTTQIADRAFWKANEGAILAAMREGRIVEG